MDRQRCGMVIAIDPTRTVHQAHFSQGNRGTLLPAGFASGGKDGKHVFDAVVDRSHRWDNNSVHHRRQQKRTLNRNMGIVCLFVGLLLPVAESVPQYYTAGYGCEVTPLAGDWASQMKITSNAMEGNVYWKDKESIAFKCPNTYGIIVQMNSTAFDDGWTNSINCPDTFSSVHYNGKVLTPMVMPVKVEYMCATHGAAHWYAGAFSIDRGGDVNIEAYFATAEFESSYSNSIHYRSMQYSALAIVLAGLIGVVFVMAPVGSPQRKFASFATMALVFAAFIGLIVAISQIRKASPRPYSYRVYHAALGYITLVIIGITLLLGAIQFYVNTLRTAFQVLVTLMLLMTITTSAVALRNFYGYDEGIIVSIAIILALLFVSSMLINSRLIQLFTPTEKTEVPSRLKGPTPSTAGIFETQKLLVTSARPRREGRKTFF